MLPKTDLFNQLYYRSSDGFVAIICYDGDIPDIDVYTPQGEWCGATRASCDLTRMADIRQIINHRIAWENQLYKN